MDDKHKAACAEILSKAGKAVKTAITKARDRKLKADALGDRCCRELERLALTPASNRGVSSPECRMGAMMEMSAQQFVEIRSSARKRMPFKSDVPVRATVSPQVWESMKTLPCWPTARQRSTSYTADLSHLSFIGSLIRVDEEMCDWRYEILYADGHTERYDFRRVRRCS